MLTNHEKFKTYDAFDALMREAHDTAMEKGFWESDNPGEKIALMHSELSEALDALRKGNPESMKIPGFQHATEELADCIIRILDFAGHFNLNLSEAIIAKMEHNALRPHKHGKKF